MYADAPRRIFHVAQSRCIPHIYTRCVQKTRKAEKVGFSQHNHTASPYGRTTSLEKNMLSSFVLSPFEATLASPASSIVWHYKIVFRKWYGQWRQSLINRITIISFFETGEDAIEVVKLPNSGSGNLIVSVIMTECLKFLWFLLKTFENTNHEGHESRNLRKSESRRAKTPSLLTGTGTEIFTAHFHRPLTQFRVATLIKESKGQSTPRSCQE